MSKDEFEKAENALRQAFPAFPKLDGLVQKMRSNNTESPKAILKDELPKLFVTARVEARFDVDEFVERVYRRRNKSSHGGSHLEHEPIIALLEDTLILAAIYLIIECIYLGLDTRDAITKFANAMRYELPLRAAG